MRKLIAGMKVSVDEKIEGTEGYADWVEAWSEDYGLMPQVVACLLGAGICPGYEQYRTARKNEPDKPLPMTGKLPLPEELKWARFIPQTTHYVLSGKLSVLTPGVAALEQSLEFFRDGLGLPTEGMPYKVVHGASDVAVGQRGYS